MVVPAGNSLSDGIGCRYGSFYDHRTVVERVGQSATEGKALLHRTGGLGNLIYLICNKE